MGRSRIEVCKDAFRMRKLATSDQSDWHKWVGESVNHYGSLMEYIRQALNYMNEFYAWLYGHCRPPATVLEAGCGTGLTAVTMGGMGYDVTAIDKEDLSIKMTKRLAKFLYPAVKVMKKDLFELKEPYKYDLVMSLGVLEHFTDEEALRMLQELAVASRKYVVVVVPTVPTFGEQYAPIRKYHDVQSLSKLLTDAGLRVVGSHAWGQSLAILGEKQTLSEGSSNVPS